MGLVHCYTGDGKGKTTASLGLVLRALGWKRKVCMIQFIKGYREIGELKFAEEYDSFTFIQVSHTEKLGISEKEVKDRKEDAEKALQTAEKILASEEYDLVVLDEINGAVHYNLVDLDTVLHLIKNKPDKTELVLTGSYAHEKIIEACDYVTELVKIKHPYDKGITARKGTDF